MNDILNQFGYSFSENFSIYSFVVNILITTILLYLLSVIYAKYGNSLSNRNQLGKVMILVGITTFIIISIVKSSLALSLGLVGALSIVRFRTAIKEPEELGYFFISIAIGLGLGANQLLPTIIGFIVLILIIIFISGKKTNSSITQSLFISLSSEKEKQKSITDKVSTILTKYSKQVSLKRLQQSNEELNLNFIIDVSSMDKVQDIFEELLKTNQEMSISFIDNEI